MQKIKSTPMKRLGKYFKDPRLIMWGIYAVLHPDVFRLPTRCAGLLDQFEVLYLHKNVHATKDIAGDILDFGSHKGLSTCTLSRAAAECNKKVVSFEWFKGLPAPDAMEKEYFQQGQYVAEEAEFRRNVDSFGNSDIVRLVKGDARVTLKDEIASKRITGFSFALIDVDLYDVIRDILFILDPLCRGGEIICVHDIHSPGVMAAIDEYEQSTGHRLIRSVLPLDMMIKIVVEL